MVLVTKVLIPPPADKEGLDIGQFLGQFDDVDPDHFANGSGNYQRLLDAFPTLANCIIDVDKEVEEDAERGAQNLAELFELTQLVMRYKDLTVKACEEKITGLEKELEKAGPGGGEGSAAMAKLKASNAKLKKEVDELTLDIAQSDDEIEKLELDLAKMTEANDKLKNSIEDLRKTSGTADAELLRQDIEEYEERLKRLMTENRDIENELEAAKTAERKCNERTTELADELTTVKKELSDLKEDINTQRERQSEGRQMIDAKNTQIRELTKTVESLQKENSALNKENVQKDQELRTLSTDVQTLAEALQTTSKDFEEMRSALADSDAAITELTRERNALRSHVEELRFNIDSKGDTEQEFAAHINAQISSWKKLLSEHEGEMQGKDKEIEKLQGEIAKLTRELERTDQSKLRQQITDRDEVIARLRAELEEMRQDMEVIGRDLLDKERQVQAEVNRLTADQQRRMEEMEKQMKELRELLEYEKTRQNDGDAILAEKEQELMDIKARLTEYENGIYGLPEAVAEIKSIKHALNRKDVDIEHLAAEATELHQMISKFQYENMVLREKAGIPEDEDIDTTEMEYKEKMEVEQLRYHNRSLQQEIDDLEQERVQLKARLRAAAWQRGIYATDREMPGDELWEMDEWRAAKMAPGLARERLPIGRPAAAGGDMEQQKELETQVNEMSRQIDKLVMEKENVEKREADVAEKLKQVEAQNEALKEKDDLQTRKIRQLLQGVTSSQGGANPTGQLSRIDVIFADWDGESDVSLESKAILAIQAELAGLQGQIEEKSGGGRALAAALEDAREEIRVLKTEVADKKEAMESVRAENRQLTEEKAQLAALGGVAAEGRIALPVPEELLETDAREVIAALNTQLIESLEDVATKERELFVLEGDLEAYKHRFQNLIDQRTTLLEEYLRERAQKDERISRMQRTIDELQGRLDGCRVLDQEVQRFDEIIDDPASDEGRRKVADVVKKVTLLRVNQSSMQRQLSNATHKEKFLTQENHELKNMLLKLELSLKRRLVNLEHRSYEAERQTRHLQDELKKSVPRDTLHNLQRKHAAVARKYSRLLMRERELIQRGFDDASTARELEETKQLLGKMEKRALIAESRSEHAEGMLEKMQSTSPDKFKALAADFSMQIATLRAQNDNAAKRAELAEKAEHRANGARMEVTDRLTQVESQVVELTAQKALAEEKATELEHQVENCISKEVSERQTKRLNDLEQLIGKLENEVAKYKSSTDVATGQVVSLMTERDQLQAQQSKLESNIMVLQNASEEASRLGRLERELRVLQLREIEATRNHENAIQENERLKTKYHKLELDLSEKNLEVHQSRDEMRSRVAGLRLAVEDLQLRQAASQPLEKVEHFAKTLRRSEALRLQLDAELSRVLKDKHKLEDRAVKAELEADAAKQIRFAAEAGEAVQKLREVMGEMVNIKLNEHRLSRSVKELEAKCTMLTDLKEDNETRLADLEVKAAEESSTLDQQILQYLGRLETLEDQLRRDRTDQQDFKQQTQQMEQDKMVLGAPPDPTLPIANQLEDALHRLVEHKRLVEQYMEKNQELATKNIEIRDHLQEARDAIIRRDMQINELRLGGGDGPPTNGGPKNGTISASDELVQKQAETQRLLKVAQQTISMMQGLLQRKEDAVVKYQEMLRRVREEYEDDRRRDRDLIQQLNLQLVDSSDSTISRIRGDLTILESGATPTGGPGARTMTSHELADMEQNLKDQRKKNMDLTNETDELKEKLAVLRHENENLNAQVIQLRETRASAEAALQKSVAKIREMEQESRKKEDMAQEREEQLAREKAAAEGESKKLKKDATVKKFALGGRLLASKAREQKSKEEAEKAAEEAEEARQKGIEQAKEEMQEHIRQVEQEAKAKAPALYSPRQPSPPTDRDDEMKRELKKVKAQLEFRETEHAQLQTVIQQLRHDLMGFAELKAKHEAVEAAAEGKLERRVAERTADLRLQVRDHEEIKRELMEKTTKVMELEKEADRLNSMLRKKTAEVLRHQRLARQAQEKLQKTKEDYDALAARRDAGPRVRELENRIKVLQKQKFGLRPPTANAEEKDDAVTGWDPTTPREDEGKGDTKWGHMEAGATERWEAEKKMQRKVEVLRRKMTEKTKENETTQAEVEQLRQKLTALEKEKEKLSARVAELTRAPRHAIIHAVEELQSVEDVQAERFRLEQDNNALTRVIEVNNTQMIEQLKRENSRLTTRVAQLEAAEHDVDDATPVDERERKLHDQIRRLKDELSQARSRLSKLEEEHDKLSEANLELRFDKEAGGLQQSRLQKRIDELHRYKEITQGVLAARGIGRDKDARELERVVDSMKKVIEKLQTENTALKKSSASQVKYMDLLKSNRALKSKLSTMESSEEEVRSKAELYDETIKRTTRLTEQNGLLRRHLKKETDLVEKLKAEKREILRVKERLEEMVEDFSKREKQAVVDADRDLRRKNQVLSDALETSDTKRQKLEAELRRLIATNGDMKSQLEAAGEQLEHVSKVLEKAREVGDPEEVRKMKHRSLLLEKESLRLMGENKKLKAELESFDPQFFEEIEDLKYNYGQALTKIKQYEEMLGAKATPEKEVPAS